MGWREQLKASPASFRGVPFQVLDHSLEGGRRHAVHEYPQRNRPFVEDLGARTRRFRLEGFIVGENYRTNRDELLKACTTAGEGNPGGELVHPYFGAIQVACDSIRVREASQEGGMCRVSLSFVESGTAPRPRIGVNAGAAADSQSENLNDLTAAQIARVLKGAGEVQEVRDATSGALAAAGEFMQSMSLNGLTQDIAAFSDQATSLVNDAAELATSPASLAAAVWDAGNALYNAAGNALEGLFAFEVLFGVDNTLGGLSSTNSQAADSNITATTDLIYSMAIAGAVRSAVRADFPSRQDAEQARDRIAAQVDLLSESADDGTYDGLRDLLATLVAGTPNPGLQLPNLEDVVLPAVLPSLVLAWNRYGDTARELELVARNNPPRPGFLPGGVTLQVLVDA